MYEDSISFNLRDIDLKDAVLLMDLNNNEDIARFVVGNPTTVTLEQEKNWILNLNNEKNTIRKIIEYNNNSIGTIIFSNIDFTNKTANINIKILAVYQGKGIGKLALLKTCDLAFNELGLYCLTAHILEYNDRSQNLFESVGFKKEGVLRERVVKKSIRQNLIAYSLLKREYVS